MIETITASAAETEAFAKDFATRLKPGDVIALFGGMGMGKTTFVRGLAKFFGCEDEVSSPTFSLVHEYAASPRIYHFDMYRVESYDDLYSTGFFDYLGAGGIMIIEWSENIIDELPDYAVRVNLGRLGDDTRRITITGDERF